MVQVYTPWRRQILRVLTRKGATAGNLVGGGDAAEQKRYVIDLGEVNGNRRSAVSLRREMTVT